MKKNETDHYEEIAVALQNQFKSNMQKHYEIKPLIGEISSSLRTLIANGYNAGELLKNYSRGIHRLHLDISILVENTENGKFELIIFEIKKLKTLGLTELSQLIGYCLVSKAKFGILINVDNTISSDFSKIVDSDKDLTHIARVVNGAILDHRFGIMIWNSTTLNIEYTNSGSIKSIPDLLQIVVDNIV